METYKIQKPTTKQLFDAIVSNEYITMQQLEQKKKQLYILLLDYWNAKELFITFANVTNTGGFPLFFSDSCSLYEVASEYHSNWYELSENEQDEIIELLGHYTQTFKPFV